MTNTRFDLSQDIRKQFGLELDEDYSRAMQHFSLILRARAKQRYDKSFLCECGKQVSYSNKKKHIMSPYHAKRSSLSSTS